MTWNEARNDIHPQRHKILRLCQKSCERTEKLIFLEKIHFNPENGLVFCNDTKFKHIAELYHIREKAEKLDATAVLFRRKYNENNDITDSKPVLYIFQKKNNFDDSEHEKLHAKIWSAGDIEVYFIVSEQLEKIYFKSIAKLFSRHPGLRISDLTLYHFWIYVH
jgi:hypothetical protein